MGTILKNGINYSGTSGGSGVSSYTELTEKPKINNVTLTGNKTTADLGIVSDGYAPSDTAETTLADGDYFPFQDVSANGKRKTLWSNIKSVLKTYFDTVYSTVTTSVARASGGTTLSLVTTGEKYNNETNITWYSTSSTAASTTAKTATLSRGTFTLVTGAKVVVKFTYANTASAPTLNVGSTGAKNIKYIDESGTVTTPVVWWNAGDVVEFIYDGTQFIMQPTYTMALAPKGTKINPSDAFSTSEKVIGCWTNGKPLYQKVVNFGTLPNAATKSVAHNISNLDYVANVWGMAVDGTNRSPLPYVARDSSILVSLNVTTTNIDVGSNINASSYTGYVVIQYTKTSDATNSFNYANPTDYSTSEKVIGTWIDGSTLYQKTVQTTLPTCTTDGVEVGSNVSTGTTIKLVCHIHAVVVNGNKYVMLNARSAGANTYTRINISNNNNTSSPNNISLTNANSGWSGLTTYITFQYTKP